MKWLSVIWQFLRLFFSTYDRTEADSEIKKANDNAQKIADAPRNDDQFDHRLRDYDSEWNAH